MHALFSNCFSIKDLSSMGLPQSIDQICGLIKTAKDKLNPKMTFELGFGASSQAKQNKNNEFEGGNLHTGGGTDNNSGNEKNADGGKQRQKQLSLKYNKGESLFVIISINEIWFKGVFVFELKPQGIVHMHMLYITYNYNYNYNMIEQ